MTTRAVGSCIRKVRLTIWQSECHYFANVACFQMLKDLNASLAGCFMYRITILYVITIYYTFNKITLNKT
jgi:hypothetical protein